MDGSHKGPPILEPLCFGGDSCPTSTETAAEKTGEQSETLVTCLFCDCSFSISESRDECLRHLLIQHKFVIADVPLIPDFKKYLDHWRPRFEGNPKEEFCTVIKTNTSASDLEVSEDYYLLCDALPEDRDIRITLQKQKLDKVLQQQQWEREDITFSRMCLFCRETFTSRILIFDHMTKDHSFSVGRPNNLVFTSELLDVLDLKLHSFLCLYCEKTFRDRYTLKEHMRKKQHKRLNPKNKSYDKFFIINYKELGKNWQELRSEPEEASDGSDTDSSHHDVEWGDWTEEDEDSAQVVCLFCTFSSPHHHALLAHMQACHKFDMEKIKKEENLNFYQQVKLLNYVRRQVHQHTCPLCEELCGDADQLTKHFSVTGHSASTPSSQQWDQPQYYFPTYENDNLLCGLEEGAPDELSERTMTSTETEVIAEDIPVTDSILTEHIVRDDLLLHPS